jgi:sigma-B regulation protein RsbU (phosphoserine phosphatase)
MDADRHGPPDGAFRVDRLEELIAEVRTLREALEGADASNGVRPLGEPSAEAACSELRRHLASVEEPLARFLRISHTEEEFDLLRDAAMLLARAVDEREVLEAILDGLRRVVPYDAAGVFLLGGDARDERVEIRAQVVRGYRLGDLDRVQVKVDQGIIGWVVGRNEPLVVDDVEHDARYMEVREGTRSEIAVPIAARGEVIGAINLEADQPAAFPAAKVRLLESLASFAAVSLEHARLHGDLIRARRLERELEIARGIQFNLLPARSPKVAGFDIAGYNVPSSGVGGDYYDYIPITEDDLGIVVADVAGKGIPASLVMAGLRAALRTRVETVYAIRAVVAEINRFLIESTGSERFVTAFYGVLDSAAGRLTYVNAGHIPPLLLHPDGSSRRLEDGGPLLGVVPGARYVESVVELLPGSVLVMVTDGIIEAGWDKGEEFGDEGVERLARERAAEPAATIAAALEREAALWSRRGEEPDDRTVVVVKRL